MRKSLITACWLLSLALGLGAADTVSFYVATNGNDTWSGRLPAPNAQGTDGPFATVKRALAALRELRRQPGVRPSPLAVEIRGGTYFLKEPLKFEPEDSGTILRAYPNEHPLFSGGVRITNWNVQNGRWIASLPEVAEGRWHFTQLFVNGQRRYRPRVPAHGYYKIAGTLDPSPKAQGKGDDRMKFNADEIRADWANLNDVEVLIFHNWSMSRLPIQSVDPDQHIVTFFGHSPSASPWGRFRAGHRYLVENVREALRQPGRWYLDRKRGELIYLPKAGETVQNTEVIAPRLEQLVVFAGDPKQNRYVEHVTLNGLTFAHAAWPIPRTGQAIPQAEVNLDGAVSAVGARSILIRHCGVLHVGAYGIAFGAGCHHNTVESCELIDLGAGGIKIGATRLDDWGGLREAASAPEPLTSHHHVRDCTIAHGGRLHPAGIGVWIGHSPYNVIEHNDIFDFYYSGMSIGWIWGYRPSHAHHNRIEYNHIHTIGQGVLSDMGAVYTLGISPGTVVNHNHIHDIHSFSYGGWGLYTDEGSSGVTMAYNLVYRTKTGGFHQHYGRDNRIFNNILAFSQTDQLQRSRVENHISFVFERNIVLYDQGQLLGKSWADGKVWMDHNLYWNRRGPVTFPGNLDRAAWSRKTGHDEHSLVADPGFVDPDHDDYHLRPGSPALRIGFEPFDYTQAGRTRPATLLPELPPVPSAFE